MTWLLPTKGRIANVRRFVNAAREHGTSTPGMILVNRSEWEISRHTYERDVVPLMPGGWKIVPVEAETYGDAVRAMWPVVKDDPWIGLVCDDLVPASSNWDKQLISSLQGWNVISSNDGWQAPNRIHGAIVWSGDLARSVGWIFPEGLTHIFHDDVWETLGRATHCWGVRMDIMCKHLHESLQGVIGPTMDRESDLWKHDEAWFKKWMEEEKDNVVGRINALKERYGVVMMKPDLSGVKLFIGTPTIDGKYEGAFMQSLFKTLTAFQQEGITVQFAEEKYTADIALGRSKLFSAFLRSDCTHYLMIDADMGWDVSAVMRLFYAKKDFVAVAGPKKRYPLQFAANYTDENDNPVNMTFDQGSGTMEIGEIGMAFCMLTRDCAERMRDSYPEMHSRGVTGEIDYSVFIPLVHKGRFYSEDFAFCRRWRNLGGHCFFCPDVSLSHTGSHTFQGSFIQAVQQNAPKTQEAV